MRLSFPIGGENYRPIYAEVWQLKNNEPIILGNGGNISGETRLGWINIEIIEPVPQETVRIYFKFFKSGQLILQTEVQEVAIPSITPPFFVPIKTTLIANFVSPPRLAETFSVKGKLVRPDGTPLSAHYIEAIDKDLVTESVIGATFSNTNGAYILYYQVDQLSQSDKTAADLQLRVYMDTQREEIIISSPLILNALAEEEINLSVGESAYRGEDTYTALAKIIQLKYPQVIAQYLQGKVSNQQLFLFAQRLKTNSEEVLHFLEARNLSNKSNGIRPEIIFAWLQKGQAMTAGELLQNESTVLINIVEAAVEDNLLHPRILENLATLSTELKTWRQAHILDQGRNNRRLEQADIGQLLAASTLTTRQRQQFIEDFESFSGTVDGFWTQQKESIGETKVKNLGLTLQLGAITRNNVPLIKSLQRNHRIRKLADVAKLGQRDWQLLLERESLVIPADILGETTEEKRNNYAHGLQKMTEAILPTQVFAIRLEADPTIESQAINRFFKTNPDFDFKATKMSTYLSDNPEVLEGARDLKIKLEALERAFHLAPEKKRYDVAAELYKNKVHSSYQIQMMGKERLGTVLSNIPEATEAVYQRALHISARSQLFLLTALDAKGVQMNVLPPTSSLSATNVERASWETLFEDLDYCSCAHCASFFSPAAYLTDLLVFLNKGKVTNPDSSAENTVLEKLFQRRPDMGNIELDCENSLRPLPYLDLVNEVLENTLNPPTYSNSQSTNIGGGMVTLPIPNEPLPQTETTAENLKAFPEHQNNLAYQILLEGENETTPVFPWGLPFNLWAEEIRLYLAHFGVGRWQLMESILGDSSQTTTIAAEYLGLLPKEVEVFIDTDSSAAALERYWGAPFSQLNRVAILLKQSAFNYKDFKQLLDLRYIQAASENIPRIIFVPASSCKVKDAKLVDNPNGSLNSTVFNRLHRFGRLVQKNKYDVIELDQTIYQLGGEVDEAFLEKWANLLRIEGKLTRKPKREALLTFWHTIDTYNYPNRPSLYHKLFLNTTIQKPLAELFQLNETGTELENTETLLDPDSEDFNPDILAMVQAAILLDGKDIKLLLEHAGYPETPFNLNLSSLSWLYRVGVLCRALKMKVVEYLSISSMLNHTGILPLNSAQLVTPAQTLQFIKQYLHIRDSGLSIELLDYFIRDKQVFPTSIALSQEELLTHLATLRDLLYLQNTEAVPTGTPISAILQSKLLLKLESDEVRKLMATYADQEEEEDQQELYTEIEVIDLFTKNIPIFTSPAAAVVDLSNLPSEADRYRYILEVLNSHLLENTAIQHLAETLSWPVRPLELFLKKATPENPERFIQLFLSADFLQSGSGSEDAEPLASFSEQIHLFRLLSKIATMISAFELESHQLEYWLRHDDNNLLPILHQLPTTPSLSPVSTTQWQRWWNLIRLVQLDKQHFPIEYSAFPLVLSLEMTSTERMESLHKATGWDKSDIDYLLGSNGLNINTTTDFRQVDWLAETTRIMDILQPLGATAIQATNWTTASIGKSQADAVRHAVKAKYGQEKWLAITTPIRDNLREMQRDALLKYVIHYRQKHDGSRFLEVDDVYAYFLMDTQMSACMMTSRIKLATASIQLFVQRIMMNLEPNISVSRDFAQEWKWRKYYRVWEANRKVFLWPENWIEPELRDDKSPFFKDLEGELLQDELNENTIERAYINYLYQLHEVGRLKICGLYYEEDKKTMHVFGQTSSIPHSYYYRRWENRKTWTAWEKVELDINNAEGLEERPEGSILIPYVLNRRLFLFWPVFTLKVRPMTEQEKENIRVLKNEIDDLHKKIDESEKEIRQQKEHMIKYFDEIRALSKLSEEDLSNFDMFGIIDIISHSNSNGNFINLLAGIHGPLFTTYLQNILPSINIHHQEIDKLKGGGYLPALKEKKAELEKLQKLHEYFEISMNWSQYRQGRWAAQRKSNDTLITENFSEPFKNGKEWERYKFIPINNGISISYFINVNEGLGELHPFTKRFEFDVVSDQLKLVNNPGLKNNYDFQGLPMEYMKYKILKEEKQQPSELGFIDLFKNRTTLLKKVSNKSWITYFTQYNHLRTTLPFFFEEQSRAFLIIPGKNNPYKLNKENGVSVVVTTASEFSKNAFQIADDNTSNFQAKVSSRLEVNTQPSGRYFQTSDADQIVISRTPPTLTNPSSFALFAKVPGNKQGRHGSSPPVKPGDLQVNFGTTKFRIFYHPHTALFLKQLHAKGIEGLLDPTQKTADDRALFRQLTPNHKANFDFVEEYEANNKQVSFVKLPRETIDFDYEGAYSGYNWELFYHIPLFIATKLSRDQRFEEAQKWFHYIFDPTETEGDAPYRFWKIKPFHTYTESAIQKDLEAIVKGEEEILEQINAWIANPFNPHLIARLRRLAYMKSVVMKYLDNLLEWGDQLFRRDSMESINEATQLYVLAAQILGKMPTETEAKEKENLTFNQLVPNLTQLNNAYIQLESEMEEVEGGFSNEDNPIHIPYFCLPPNEKLLGYWTKVADRLFKIRHCINIEGIMRQLPLFQPPIDPAILVRAVAAGVDIGSAINDLFAPMPLYRFQTILRQAIDLTNELKSLGGSLLSSLEKKDAEALAKMRQMNEIDLLKANKTILDNRIKEVIKTYEALEEGRQITNIRYENYLNREKKNAEETHASNLKTSAGVFQIMASSISFGASISALIPDQEINSDAKGPCSGLGTATKVTGGEKIAKKMKAIAKAFDHIAKKLKLGAELSASTAHYARRKEDWDLQRDLAAQELKQIEKQLAAAEIRQAITEQEKSNLEIQIERTKKQSDFLHRKYTNQELYNWMSGQLSAVYFQTYKLAYDIAKQAEKAFQFELGIENSKIIQFGYWDNLRKGLLSGEKLGLDLRRLEAAYLQKNKRELEITKHISLRQLNPDQLLILRATGNCKIYLPEWLFDLDCPGHYHRRIKTVALSIPAITGPYTSVNCTLTLHKSTIRKNPLLTNNYARATENEAHFLDRYSNDAYIVTSSGQNDSGLFEVNLRDERYLPFEGMGVISEWDLQLPDQVRQFNYDTISDVILHIRYTAKEGGNNFRGAAQTNLETYLENISDDKTPLFQLFSLKHDFPQAWHQFKKSEEDNFTATIKKEHFPYLVQAGSLADFQIQLYTVNKGAAPEPLPLESIAAQNLEDLNETGMGRIEINRDSIDLEADEIFLVIGYTFSSNS